MPDPTPDPTPDRSPDRSRSAARQPEPAERAAEVAAAVLAHPAVERLDAGPFGTVASYLPGRRRVVGVRLGVPGEPVEIAVVALLGNPLPRLAAELGAAVRAVLGPVEVDVTVADVTVADVAVADVAVADGTVAYGTVADVVEPARWAVDVSRGHLA